MELKSVNNQSINDILRRFQFNKSFKIFFVICIIFSVLAFILGGLTLKAGYWKKTILATRIIYQDLPRYFNSFFIEPPEKLIIDIKFKNYNKILSDRAKALKDGFLINPRYVPATISLNGENYKVKLRLKGDHLDHLRGDQWSYRVKVKGDNAILGMKRFSLQHPKTRNYIAEWLFHSMLKDNGVVGLRYNFLNVYINGKDLGIYALEEHFDKRLIENNEKKEGPIIKFNEEGFWQTLLNGRLNSSEQYLISEIDSYENNDLSKRAITLLENYRSGKNDFEEIFDIELFAKHYAISRILGSMHGEVWHNRRFYFNPITDKLEPIGFDGVFFNYSPRVRYINNLFDNSNFYWLSNEKNNYKLISKIAEYIEEFSKTDIFLKYKNDLEYYQDLFYRNFPDYSFDKNYLVENQKYYLNVLYPHPKNLVSAYIVVDSSGYFLKIGNNQSWPLKIGSLDYKGETIILKDDNLILPGKYPSAPAKYYIYPIKKKELFEKENFELQNLKIYCKIIGTSKFTEVLLSNWNHNEKLNVTNSYLNGISNINEIPFIDIVNGQKLLVKPGVHNIIKNINIPSGHTLVVKENTTINLINGASILSRSPVLFMGSEEKPIFITSSDSTGQGLFLVQTNDKSKFEHTIFSNLSNPNKNGWSLTGAVTFYESDVEIINSIFTNNLAGDDYLNIVRSQFALDNVAFINTVADAFDSDFSNGTITNSNFFNCGNDGLDISGSKIVASYLKMRNVGDKAISGGENSHLIIDNIELYDSAIGVCSKDMSKIIGSNITLDNIQVGFTAFQKKPEFGFASIDVKDVEINNSQIKFLIEAGSDCFINRVAVKNTKRKVENILYGATFGKASN